MRNIRKKQAITDMINLGKAQGYLTYAEINDMMPEMTDEKKWWMIYPDKSKLRNKLPPVLPEISPR